MLGQLSALDSEDIDRHLVDVRPAPDATVDGDEVPFGNHQTGLVMNFLRHLGDQRLQQLGLAPLYCSKNPFQFMELQDVQEVTNFFERRVSAYQVAVQGEVAFDQAF